MTTLIDSGGFVGSLLIAGAFALQAAGATRWQRQFLYANLCGTLLLIPPAIIHATPQALLLSIFWLLVTCAALADGWRSRNQAACDRILKVTAAAILAAVAWAAAGNPTLLQLGAACALALFMGGYFLITRDPGRHGYRVAYFASAMAGNILYIPLLYAAGNYPNLSLQVAGMLLAIYGLMQTKNRKIQIA